MTLAEKARRQQQEALEHQRDKRKREEEALKEAARARGERYAAKILEHIEDDIRKSATEGRSTIGLPDPRYDDNYHAISIIEEWAKKNGFHIHRNEWWGGSDDWHWHYSASLCWDDHKNDRNRW